MRDKYSYNWEPGCSARTDPVVEPLLKKYRIRCHEVDIGNRHFVRFNLYSDKPEQKELIERFEPYRNPAFMRYSETVYTDQERMNAEYLVLYPNRLSLNTRPFGKRPEYDGCPCLAPRYEVRIGKEH